MRMKDANQLKAKIKNVALQKGVDPRVLMRVYMMERFLDRVSHSHYKDNFVLKGGMLISYLVGVNLRTTMDIDTTMQNISLSEDDVRIFISDVVSINIDDGVKFTLQTLDSIMQESDYPGVRASLVADFDGTKTPVKIDISTGHANSICYGSRIAFNVFRIYLFVDLSNCNDFSGKVANNSCEGRI